MIAAGKGLKIGSNNLFGGWIVFFLCVCVKFVELLIINLLERLILQSISFFKVIRAFSNWLNEKPFSYLYVIFLILFMLEGKFGDDSLQHL